MRVLMWEFVVGFLSVWGGGWWRWDGVGRSLRVGILYLDVDLEGELVEWMGNLGGGEVE